MANTICIRVVILFNIFLLSCSSNVFQTTINQVWVSNRTESQILFKWNTTTQGGPSGAMYDLKLCRHYREGDCYTFRTDDTSYQYGNLDPGSQYVFTVKHVNGQSGEMGSWNTLTVLTKPLSPSSYDIKIAYNTLKTVIIAETSSVHPEFHDKLCLKLQPSKEMYNQIIKEDFGCILKPMLNKPIPMYIKRELKYNLEAVVCLGDVCGEPSQVSIVPEDFKTKQNWSVLFPVLFFIAFFSGIFIYVVYKKDDIPFEKIGEADDDSGTRLKTRTVEFHDENGDVPESII